MSSEKRTRPWIWIVSGPSGSGKTSLCEALLKDALTNERFLKSVSYTTRPLRRGEKEGVDYIHVPEKKFKHLLQRKAFLEKEKIFGFYYGTPKNIIAQARRLKKNVLLCVDVKGARTIKKSFGPEAVSIFIIPPRLEELGKRLKKRSTEDKKGIEKRLKRVRLELSYRKDYEHIIVNDNFKEALEKLKFLLTTTKGR